MWNYRNTCRGKSFEREQKTLSIVKNMPPRIVRKERKVWNRHGKASETRNKFRNCKLAVMVPKPFELSIGCNTTQNDLCRPLNFEISKELFRRFKASAISSATSVTHDFKQGNRYNVARQQLMA